MALALLHLAVMVMILAVAAKASEEASWQQKQTKGDGILFGLRILGLDFDGDQHVEPQTEFKVIGAGNSRSGTKSTKAALEMLGYKVFHMEDFQTNRMVIDLLQALASDYHFDLFISKVLSLGYNATLDFPMYGLAPRLSKRFPKAKVLYGVRDSHQQNADSLVNLFTKFRYTAAWPLDVLMDLRASKPAYYHYHRMTYTFPACKPGTTVFQWIPWFKCLEPPQFSKPLVEVFIEWNATLHREIEPERLLTFNVKEGWDPLVKFLGHPKPAVSFPKLNEASTLEAIEKVTIFIVLTWPGWFFIIALFCCWIGELVMKTLRYLCRRTKPI